MMTKQNIYDMIFYIGALAIIAGTIAGVLV